jgi:hypothetical protein
MYRSSLSLTSALDGVGGQRHAQPLQLRERDPVAIVEEAGLAPGPGGQMRKISPPPGFDPRTVQPVASVLSYTGPRTLVCTILYYLILQSLNLVSGVLFGISGLKFYVSFSSHPHAAQLTLCLFK